MAGGKETPRQKMIGMMYLVLTALLAMNVSSAILQKFHFLNGSLEHARDVAVARNEGKLADIKFNVKERGEKPEEVKIMKEAKEVRSKTKEVMSYIEDLKSNITKESGGPSEKKGGMIPGAKNRDAVQVLMLGGNKNGKAYELKKKLNGFVDYLNTHAPDARKHDYFALDGKDDPLFKNDPEQKGKDFAELNFEETPAVAALAVLSQMQSKVSTYESEVLNELGAKVGASDFKFDIVNMMTKPESRIIAAGTKYKAEMFISATSSTLNPAMRWKQSGGKDFTPIDTANINGGIGMFEFRASGGGYDKDGRSKRKWVGEIAFKGPEGDTVRLLDTVEYIVSKPVIQVQSASVSALYLNCGNELNVQVPALGEEYNPSFNVTGGSAIKGKEKGFVTIIPKSPKVKLTVNSGGSTVGTEEFRVRKIPLPTIEVLSRGRKVNMKKGMPAPGPRALQFVAKPDAGFKEFLPKDARYVVATGEAILVRGKRPVQRTRISNGQANLSSLAASARDGDRILIEIKKVLRKNFRGQVEEVTGMGAMIYNIPLTD